MGHILIGLPGKILYENASKLIASKQLTKKSQTKCNVFDSLKFVAWPHKMKIFRYLLI